MACSPRFINTLIRYGERDPANKAKLEEWLDEAIESVADGKGGHVVSASANGASFSQVANMTNAEWASCLDEALLRIEQGVKSTSRSYGAII